MLHHVIISRVIEKNQQFKYDNNKHNPYWMIDGPWYNKYICTKLYGTVFGKYIKMKELAYTILCVLLMYMRNNIHNMLMRVTAVEVMHYHLIR